jgi:hypothetical protein
MKTIGLFFCLLLIPATTVFSDEDTSAKKSKPPFTISKETTYLTEPLTEDGYVDYVAALNKMCSEGVTVENNAAVLLLDVLGPQAIDESHRSRYFQMLGIAPLPENGDYMIKFETYYQENNYQELPDSLTQDASDETQKEFQRFHNRAMSIPWTAAKYPFHAKWLKANQKPLEKILSATRREKYFSPLIAKDNGGYEPLIGVVFNLEIESRYYAKLLLYHAMFSLGEGKFEEAKRDLLACHRLARLVGQGPMLINGLVCVAIEDIACHGDANLAQSGKLSSSEILAYGLELKKLPPLCNMTEKLDKCERLVSLDFTEMIAKTGMGAISAFDRERIHPIKKWAAVKLASAVEWDIVMRMQNAWFDRMIKIARMPSPVERNKEWDRFEDDLQQLRSDANSWKSVGDSLMAGESVRTIFSNKIGDIIVNILMPALHAVTRAEVRGKVNIDMTFIAIALDAYRADNGSYPEQLADLKPKYLAEIPKDRFSYADLIYRHDRTGYILYSIGNNGKDDSGKSVYSDPPDEDGDDLVVRTPKETK